MSAQTKKKQELGPPRPIVWHNVMISKQVAIPASVPDKCPTCGVGFVEGYNLEEMFAQVFCVNVNKSGALCQVPDDDCGADGYMPEMKLLGYQCNECKTPIVGCCGIGE